MEIVRRGRYAGLKIITLGELWDMTFTPEEIAAAREATKRRTAERLGATRATTKRRAKGKA